MSRNVCCNVKLKIKRGSVGLARQSASSYVTDVATDPVSMSKATQHDTHKLWYYNSMCNFSAPCGDHTVHIFKRLSRHIKGRRSQSKTSKARRRSRLTPLLPLAKDLCQIHWSIQIHGSVLANGDDSMRIFLLTPSLPLLPRARTHPSPLPP